MQPTKRNVLLGVAAVLALGGGAFAVNEFFLPESAVKVDEELPASSDSGASGPAFLKAGTFEGKAGHHVSGTATIVDIDGVLYLRSEDYEQTQGPDVFVYLTPSATPDSYDEIERGVKIRIDGGPDGGEIVKEGNFHQRLPDGLDVSQFHGVAIWCDQFRVPFGYASLHEP